MSAQWKRPWKRFFEEVRLRKYILGFLLILIFPLPLWGQPHDFDPNRSPILVFSSNVYGEVEPCG